MAVDICDTEVNDTSNNDDESSVWVPIVLYEYRMETIYPLTVELIQHSGLQS